MNDSANRLREARERAGFQSAAQASERFGWTYPTYSAHENGSRGIRTSAAMRYARAFGVDPLWLMTGRTPTTRLGSATEPAAAGFAEAELQPFAPRPTDPAAQLLALLRPQAGRVLAYTAQRDYQTFSILAGDILVIGEPQNDDDSAPCVVTLADPQTASAVTVLRQVLGGKVVPMPFVRDVPDGHTQAAVLGRVAAVIRWPARPPATI